MASSRVKKGEKIREGKTFPLKTCDRCGETKNVQYFPKRAGIYKKYKSTDERRYDNQCKKCRRPVRPGQDRDELPEIKLRAAVQRGKAAQKTVREKKKRSAEEKRYQRTYKQRVREETRIQSMIYLADKGCEECGERDPRKLEYDHKDPGEKRDSIANFIVNGYSWTAPAMVAEVAKCRIICSNCHRVHTVKQQGYYAFDEVQRTLGRLAARYKFDL